ncbi:MAG TPA: T9SS type A sorting domain-containing protein [Bacteroidetes bacterium]|nr:T9SS type A sorting domain-containing protein [Bacteroidota bacterium]
MKKKNLLIIALSLLMLGVFTGEAYSFRNGAPAGKSGGAGEATCATSSCHAGALNSGPGTLTINSNAPGGVYTPGDTYLVTVRLAQTGISRFGFEVLAAFSPLVSKSVGFLNLTNSGETKLLTSGLRKYVTHTSSGTLGTNFFEWDFEWKAPDTGVGDVQFFVAGNAANNNGNKTGDLIYSQSLTLTQLPVGTNVALANPTLEVYPSFASTSAFLHLENAGLSPLQVQVLNQNGQVVQLMRILPAGTDVHRKIDLSGLATGVYYVRVLGNSGLLSDKFVKFE